MTVAVSSDRHVPFICVADGNVVPALLALIASAATHLSRDWQLSVHVLDLGLGADKQQFIKRSLQPFRDKVVLEFRTLGFDVATRFKGSDHVHVATYGKCFLAEIFDDMSWGIYADVDILIRTDLSILGYSMLGGRPLAAVQDWEGCLGDRLPRTVLDADGLDPVIPYFNAGFLLLDLQQMRSVHLQEQVLTLIGRHGEHFKYLDQDAFNLALRGNWMRLDNTFNTLFPLMDELPRRLPRKACNPHTVGRNKAWKFKRAGAHGLVRSFYDYLDMTDAGYEDCPGAHLQYAVGLKIGIRYLTYYYRRFLRTVKTRNGQ